MTATPAPVRAQGTCTVCDRDVDLLPGGDRVSAHRKRVSDDPVISRGSCPGKHQPPKTKTTEV